MAAAHAPANLSLLIVRMDPSLSDGAAGDSGTKKKSSFQITSVRKGDTASLSSEVGAIDEFDVDNEEGDGEEDDDNLSASVALDQVGDEIIPDNSDLVGQTARGVPQSHSQSKYRVVRIKKQSVIDRHFERGRWECWDLRDGNLDPPHTQGEDEDDEAARKNDSPRRKSENCQDSESPGTPDEGKRNGYGGSGPEGTSAVATGDQRAAPGKRVAFVPVATSTIGNTSAVAVQDTPPSRLVFQPASGVVYYESTSVSLSVFLVIAVTTGIFGVVVLHWNLIHCLKSRGCGQLCIDLPVPSSMRLT